MLCGLLVQKLTSPSHIFGYPEPDARCEPLRRLIPVNTKTSDFFSQKSNFEIRMLQTNPSAIEISRPLDAHVGFYLQKIETSTN